MVWSPWSQKYALLLLLSVHPLTFCISHLFCHAVSWLWHEVVLSPWWEVCCRQEPVHSWHLLKTKQAVYKYLFTMPYAFIYSGICWNRKVFYTLNHIYLLWNQHLYAPSICWNKKRPFTHQTTPTYYDIGICKLLASAETKQISYTPSHTYLVQSLFDVSNTMSSAFAHSWHPLKQKIEIHLLHIHTWSLPHQYWAVQWSWFAQVNALCNLSCKMSQEVAASLPGRFLSRCFFTICTMEVELRIVKQNKCHQCCSCKNYQGRGWRVEKSVFASFFCWPEDCEFVEKMCFGASYSTSNKLLLVARHILITGLQKCL